MHIAIDIREASKPKKTGKGQWTYGFVNELLTRDVSLTLLSDGAIPTEWSQPQVSVTHFSHGMRWHFQVKKFLLKKKGFIHLYVSPTSYICPFLLGTSFPCMPIVHDLIAFRNEPHNTKAQLIERALLRTVVQTASVIGSVSESTKKDLLKKYRSLPKHKIIVLYAGPMRSKVSQNSPDGKTIVNIGTLCPRKNQLRLIGAYASLPLQMREQYSLVLAGMRGWQDDEIVRLAEHIQGVTWKDYVSEKTYEELLDTCTVFAFPSLYEGFGMQVLDALQRGVPLLLSNRGSLQEVAGDNAIYVNPEETEDIAEGLLKLLQNEDLRKNLATHGKEQADRFSWKKTVDLFLAGITHATKQQ